MNDHDLCIRPECPDDLAAIRAVHTAAFGRPAEARLVDALRDMSAFVPELSLVAVADDAIVGHVLFSRIEIHGSERTVAALALAPLAVLPGWQRRGIGRQLVRAGHERARALGHRLVVVLGHPEYYLRFGFVPASSYGIAAPFAVPNDAFMVAELQPGAAADAAGVVEYPPPFAAV